MLELALFDNVFSNCFDCYHVCGLQCSAVLQSFRYNNLNIATSLKKLLLLLTVVTPSKLSGYFNEEVELILNCSSNHPTVTTIFHFEEEPVFLEYTVLYTCTHDELVEPVSAIFGMD